MGTVQDDLGGGVSLSTADTGPADTRILGPAGITPADPRYPDFVHGLNRRFVGTPEAVHTVGSAAQIAPILEAAVRQDKRITVVNAGHCLEGFPFEPDVRVVLNVSKLDRISFDTHHNAISIDVGANLGEVYETLYEFWGVTIPGGSCRSVGIGGHVAGGGWGMLCRAHGLVVDHLYGVEVVTVNAAGKARTVVATREKDDPNRELWWAHTGGGGGNFGVVTRYLFRSPKATGDNPGTLLPRPPASVWLSAVSLPWADLSKAGFKRLLRNFGDWHVTNSAPGIPASGLVSMLVPGHKSGGQIALITQVDATKPGSRELLDSYLAAVVHGVGVQHGPLTAHVGEFRSMPTLAEPRLLPWLEATHYLGSNGITLNDPTLRADYKSAYHKANLTDRQLEVIYEQLVRPDITNPQVAMVFSSFGGQVNAVAENATASSHRSSAFKLLWTALWSDPADDDKYIAYLREFYQQVYADTGGVPVPNEATDGCYVNYPDIDLNDFRFNKSSVQWHHLYYKDNYPRLQQVKKKYDPRNVFRHEQSVRLPS